MREKVEEIDNIETLLERRIKILFEEVERLPAGSEERELAYRELLSYYDVHNNEEKIYAEKIKNEELNELELQKLELEREKFEYQKMNEEKSFMYNFFTWIGDHTAIAIGTGVSYFLTWKFSTKVVMPFEQTGVLSNGVWRDHNIFSRLRWFKR